MTRIVTVKMPEAYVEKLEELVKEGKFATRSEAIREAIRLLFLRYGLISAPEYFEEHNDLADEVGDQ